MLYKSQFRKIDPYDWFCGPGSHMWWIHMLVTLATIIVHALWNSLCVRSVNTMPYNTSSIGSSLGFGPEPRSPWRSCSGIKRDKRGSNFVVKVQTLLKSPPVCFSIVCVHNANHLWPLRHGHTLCPNHNYWTWTNYPLANFRLNTKCVKFKFDLFNICSAKQCVTSGAGPRAVGTERGRWS